MKTNYTFPSPIIKICGLTSREQALNCVELGVDWLGLNCWPGSSRYVTPEKTQEIVSALPKSVTTVGVFVNESPDLLESIMRETGMNWAQLHGDESLQHCKKLSVSWFKAFRVSPEFKVQQIQDYGQKTFLLDAYSKTHYGGSGQTINWKMAESVSGLGQLILAGGLTPENVSEAVKKVNPWGVDVCSGVESEPGIKDLSKVKEFVRNVRDIANS